MQPRKDLNDRFKGYIAKARRMRQLVATSLVVTCLLVGSGLALGMVPPDGFAGAKRSMASATASFSRLFASVSDNPPDASQQLAAASTSGIGEKVFRIVCTILRNCPTEPGRQLTENQKSQHTTTSQNVNPSKLVPPAPTEGGATATPVAVSNKVHFGSHLPGGTVLGETDTQPIERVIETVRTVIESGLTAADVDARMLALQRLLQAQIDIVAAKTDSKSETIYQTLGMVARIENLHDVNLTNITVNGVSGLTDADLPEVSPQATTSRSRAERSQDRSPAPTSRSPAR
jgi:hypothetical protein